MAGSELQYDIVFFDGVCNLCNDAVQFIIRHDKNCVFRFTSLQSNFAKSLLNKYHVEIAEPPQSILLLRSGKISGESSAVFRIAQKLDGRWKLLSLLLILPRFVADAVYRFVAHNRYTWFGKREVCMVPTQELKERFLD